MNIKVVIVWAVTIVIFAGIGIFGYFNKDLLTSDVDVPFVPQPSENNKAKTCNKSNELGSITYQFLRDEQTNMINKITMTYKASSADLDAYTAASNINNANINGLTASLSGGLDDFILVVQVNMNGFDKVSVDNMLNDFLKVSMVIESITDLTAYQATLNASSSENPYTCD